MADSIGRIIIRANLNVWPHELRTAQALAKAGYTIEFVSKSDVDHVKTADVLIGNIRWEFKAPRSGKTKMIQTNLRRALHQSNCVVFDSRRMKGLPNQVIEREVRLRANELKSLKHLLYINRHGEVVVVK